LRQCFFHMISFRMLPLAVEFMIRSETLIINGKKMSRRFHVKDLNNPSWYYFLLHFDHVGIRRNPHSTICNIVLYLQCCVPSTVDLMRKYASTGQITAMVS